MYDKWQSYDVWFLRYEVQQTEFLSFWAIFCPFTPLTTQKSKILKKWKKRGEISSFYTSVPKIMIIYYTVPKIWYLSDVILLILIFSPLRAPLPLAAQKIKKNIKKTCCRYHHFTYVYQNVWSDGVWFLRYGVWQMDW